MLWWLSFMWIAIYFVIRAALLIVLIAVGGVGLLNAIIVFSTVGRIVEKVPDEDHGNRTAVILGASPLGEFLQRRIETGVELYRSGQVQRILVSGDGGGPYYNEVDSMTVMLVKAGVPRAAIDKDPLGLRTYASMKRAKENFHIQSAIIVTQRFHNFRALYLARANGIDAVAIDAQDPITGSLSQVHMREWLARPLAFWEVHIKAPAEQQARVED